MASTLGEMLRQAEERARGQESFLEDAGRRKKARGMQAFYEPQWFGQPTQYGNTLASVPANTKIKDVWGPTPVPPGMRNDTYEITAPPPTTMGGFSYGGAPGGMQSAYDAPPIGMANLGRYGMGQLKNYGKGVPAYGKLLREEFTRWR